MQSFILFGGLGQLARKGHSELVSPIIESLFDHKDDEVRANAAKVVGRFGTWSIS